MTVTPNLSISLTVTCPFCGHFFCLIDDTNLNKEGALLNEILPDECWTNAHEFFEKDIHCPECSAEFLVKGINYS